MMTAPIIRVESPQRRGIAVLQGIALVEKLDVKRFRKVLAKIVGCS